jgi:hypothetical protein
MSHTAIYEATRALRVLLHSQLVLASASANVTLLPPGDALPAASGVNLYLYRVTESASFRNRPWPGDRDTPPSNQPALALELSYLLTPLGTRPDDASYELSDDAHTMLGVAMQTLYENPILNDVHIPGFDADAVLPPYLADSYEQLKISLLATSVEELSKIWAAINQPYRLSVAYELSLVELTPTRPPPVSGAIVATTNVGVVTAGPPRPASLVPAVTALASLAGSTVMPNSVVISGSGFGYRFDGDTPVVLVGGQPAPIADTPAPSAMLLTVMLPADLDAGPEADVRVTLNGQSGIPLALTVSPWLSMMSPIRTSLDAAAIPAEMDVILQGQGFTGASLEVRFDTPGVSMGVPANPGATATQLSTHIPATLANGLYQVRVRLGGPGFALSNSRTLEVIPQVDTPIGIAIVAVTGGTAHQLTIAGNRLNGADVRILIDGAEYLAGANANPGMLTYTLGGLLPPATHTLAVDIDGHHSRVVELVVGP